MSENERDIKDALDWDGRDRLYELHLPPHWELSSNLPLVVVLHGAKANATYARRMSQMDEKADQEGFAILYPNGTGIYKHAILTWNAQNCCGYAYEHNIDDVGFLKFLIEEVARKYPIDREALFLTGISNGAMMAYRFACECPDMVRAMAPVAGVLNDLSFTLDSPISLIAFHGTADQHTPYNGGEGPETLFPRVDKPVQEVIKYWAIQNGCSETPDREEKGDVVVDAYANESKNVEVLLYTLKGGMHSWPGGKPGIQNGNIDPPFEGLSATDVMWEFFKSKIK